MVELKYVVPFLTLLLGGLIVNRLALGREKERNLTNYLGHCMKI